MNQKQRAVRIAGGLLAASSLGLVPMSALANHGTGGMEAHAGTGGMAGASHGPGMPPPAQPGMAGHHGMDDHARSAAHHEAAMVHPPAPMAAQGHKAMKPMDKPKKKDAGRVEGGSGASDNDGGTIAGDHAPGSHAHGDNQGGDIH